MEFPSVPFTLQGITFSASGPSSGAYTSTNNPGSGGSGDLVVNGGMESGGWPVLAAGTNVANYTTGQVPGESARSGRRYLATNTPSSGGSVYQDIGLKPGSAEHVLRHRVGAHAVPTAPGARGTMCCGSGFGGSYNDSGSVRFSGLGNGSNWRQVSTCVQATTAHSFMRVQFYPDPGYPHPRDPTSMSTNRWWRTVGWMSGSWPGSPRGPNVANYTTGQVPGESARSGRRYLAATRLWQRDPSIRTSGSRSPAVPSTYCATAWVRTQYPATGARGTYVVWLVGGSYNDSGSVRFSGLGNGSNWRQVSTCVQGDDRIRSCGPVLPRPGIPHPRDRRRRCPPIDGGDGGGVEVVGQFSPRGPISRITPRDRCLASQRAAGDVTWPPTLPAAGDPSIRTSGSARQCRARIAPPRGCARSTQRPERAERTWCG